MLRAYCPNIYTVIKGLVPKSANLECQSITHNENSPATLARIYSGNFDDNIIIDEGVIVWTHGTRCDGIIQCFGGKDEKGCGDTKPYSIVLIGTYFTLLVYFKFLLSSKGQKILKANNDVLSFSKKWTQTIDLTTRTFLSVF